MQGRTAYRDGTTHVIFEPEDFIARLAALVPKPRAHLTRYHGVFAPASPDRARIVPKTCAADDELPESLFSTACGAALIRWLRGASVRVEVVATVRPMFWLCAANGVYVLDDLRERTIASYPEGAPPAQFLRIVLEDAGLTPGLDVKLVSAPDDAARIEMLSRRDAVAALTSSATLPHRPARPGFHELLCVGDRLRVPTTGLAINLAMVERHPGIVNAMADAFRAALQLIHEDGTVLHEALRDSPSYGSSSLRMVASWPPTSCPGCSASRQPSSLRTPSTALPMH